MNAYESIGKFFVKKMSDRPAEEVSKFVAETVKKKFRTYIILTQKVDLVAYHKKEKEYEFKVDLLTAEEIKAQN